MCVCVCVCVCRGVSPPPLPPIPPLMHDHDHVLPYLKTVFRPINTQFFFQWAKAKLATALLATTDCWFEMLENGKNANHSSLPNTPEQYIIGEG